MRTINAALVRTGDRVILDARDVTVTHIDHGKPLPGRLLFTDSAGRSFGMGATAQVQLVKATS